MSIIRLGFIGAGGMARYHIDGILKQTDTTRVTAICEPNAANYKLAREMFVKAKQTVPQNEPNFNAFVEKFANKIDAAFIVTPHVEHFSQAKALLEAGVDVLLEKPMVMNTSEAKRLMKARDKSGRLLAVAFNGSMGPAIRHAAELIRSGAMGRVLNVSSIVWQNWEQGTRGLWRQEPKISGGGFMFDTGAHLLNTVADLIGEPFTHVAAFSDKRKTKVDILTVGIAKTKSGVLVTINGCGSAPVTASEVNVFCEKGVIFTGVWGEFLKIQMAGEQKPQEIPMPHFHGAWQTFVKVRNGEIENPCPAEIGLRMIQLWDAIKASAKKGGALVEV
jgi:predicted dehydrogenase